MGDPPKASAAGMVAPGTRRHVRGPRHPPGFRGAHGDRAEARHSAPAFRDLIQAFIQDQTVARYRDWEELFGYCRYSANPVGRLVLHLCGYSDARRQRLSDATCTALQLANFWQDVTVDLLKDRVYIPLELMERHGYTVEELRARRSTPAFREVMREAVEKARELFFGRVAALHHGGPAAGARSGFVQPRGLRVLEKIAR